jgi:hypothetical protein
MSPREAESDLLDRCAAAARGQPTAFARDRREANVFRVAAMIVRGGFPSESAQLMDASARYFGAHPSDRVSAEEVVRNGWVFSLPRLRDMLTRRLIQR